MTPTRLDFGVLPIGSTSEPLWIGVLNETAADYGPLSIELQSAEPGFFRIVEDTCDGQVLPVGASCVVKVVFDSYLLGSAQGEVIVSPMPFGAGNVPLTGRSG